MTFFGCTHTFFNDSEDLRLNIQTMPKLQRNRKGYSDVLEYLANGRKIGEKVKANKILRFFKKVQTFDRFNPLILEI